MMAQAVTFELYFFCSDQERGTKSVDFTGMVPELYALIKKMNIHRLPPPNDVTRSNFMG